MAPQERKDHHTTTVNGVEVYLNPLPTDYKDRLVWAFFNSSAIGANRASRGLEELDNLSAELNIPCRNLRAYLRGILDTEARAEAAKADEIEFRIDVAIDFATEDLFKSFSVPVVLALPSGR